MVGTPLNTRIVWEACAIACSLEVLKMNRKFVVALASFVCLLNVGLATDLVVQEIMEPTTSMSSKPLQARVEEIARNERASALKVNVYASTSVARGMIVVRGL